MNDQMIFKRYEIKYLLSAAQTELVQAAMERHMVPDEHGRSTILSLYFDTPDFLLARRSMEHPLYKEKLRLRSYGIADSDSTVFVELKKKYDSVVYKRRIAVTEDAAERYLLGHIPVADTQISREIDYCMSHYPGLAPKVLLSYEREAFYGKNDHGLRVTFDHDILWRDTDVSLKDGVYGAPLLADDEVLMEVKTGGALPLWLAHLLSENEIYHTAFSKYGSAYTAICGGRHAALHSDWSVQTAEETAFDYEKGRSYHYA